MSMHLKWAHNMKVDEYIGKYGEYRPKQLKENELKTKSNIECKECNKKFKSHQHLMYHITKSHPEISKSDYIIKHMMNGVKPLCKCGCGEEVTILENGKNCDLDKDTYHRDYIKGHWDWEVFSNIGKQSKEEILLVNFIKSIYKGEIQTNVRGLIKNNEIDIFIPELSLAVEYNGLYWHSEKSGKMNDYHINKTKLCNELGIRLIHIFSDEWILKEEIIKQKLISIITKPKNRIYARKCIIKEITPKQKNDFLNSYHIQGEDRSSIKLGLFYNDNLVGVMTFSKPRISLGSKSYKNNSFELSRFALSLNVIGGASKLLKFFIKNHTPSHIYSYSDNRYSDPNNNMYLKIGFIKTNSSKPGYFYTKDFQKRLHRFNFNKGILKKMGCDVENKTEKEIMNELGYTRIWDCGTTRYDLEIK